MIQIKKLYLIWNNGVIHEEILVQMCQYTRVASISPNVERPNDDVYAGENDNDNQNENKPKYPEKDSKIIDCFFLLLVTNTVILMWFCLKILD